MDLSQNFAGVYPALLTPFDKDDRVNVSSLEKLIEMNIKKGVTGFYVDGSTAEAFLLSYDERKEILRAASEITKGRVKLIAHVGSTSQKEAVSLAEYAQELGYDAVSSVAPFYYKYSFGEIKNYYFAIADAVTLPVIIYNIPSFSGVNLSVENIGEFLEDSRFVGVKHTSSDYFQLRQFKQAFPSKTVFNGFDETFLAGLSMGADGAIGSTFNFMAEKFIEIQRLFNANDIHGAQKIQNEADVIITALCRVGVMQGEKAILDAMGIPMGNARRPFRELSPDEKKSLLDAVEKYL